MEHNPVHNSTSTTFKVDAGTKRYHCGFFCQRKTTSDVIEPSQTQAMTPVAETKHQVSREEIGSQVRLSD
jgi:hypothetical protein